MIKSIIGQVGIALLILYPASSHSYPKTESDYKLLPPYCKARSYGLDSPQAKQWKPKIGEPFTHIHHYCAGLHALNNANLKIYNDPLEKKRTLQHVVDQCNYVIEKTKTKTSPLMPEIYTTRGKALLRLDKVGEALQSFQTAISLNKKYAPAYIAIADLFISQNNQQEALNIVKRGLKYSPRSKGLKRRLDKLQDSSPD